MSGRYKVDTVLGKGAHATVCIARRLDDGATVALKVLRADLVNDAPLLARMRDEAMLLSTLDDPNIVKVFALHEYRGRPVFEMEWLDGASLERVARDREAPFPAVIAAEIIRRAAGALDRAYHVHAPGTAEPLRIIHRDLKPENLLLTRTGEVKIVDCGIAKADFSGRSAKTLGVVVGSAGFDAPERRLGSDSPASDVYALGVTLYVLTTGHTLVLPRDEAARNRELQRALDPVGEELAHPEALRYLISRMIAVNPSDRPTASEVAAEIDACLAAEGGRPDLPAWAAEVPWHDPTQIPAQEHPEWGQLAFLETELPTPTVRRPADEVRAELTALLGQPDWFRRLPEVERLLASADARADGPLIALLGRDVLPWWQFWGKPARAEELEAALWLLADRPTNDAVAAANRLTGHASPGVARSARLVLERARAG